MKKSLPKTKVLIQLRDKVSPIHKRFLGQELRAALPNQAATDLTTGEKIPSFEAPYQVLSAAYVDKRDMERFMKELDARGFCL